MQIRLGNTEDIVLIDANKLKLVSTFKGWYKGLKRYVYGYKLGDKRGYRLHRIVLGVTDKNVIVDHINGNKLDNRKKNLRITTAKVNAVNKRTTPNGKYRGVYWDKGRQSWQISVRADGKNYSGGRYKDKEKAAKVAELLRRKVFGKDHPKMKI